MMPSFFIAHGAPSLALEHNDYTAFLSDLGKQLPRPKAIVLVSAHWEHTNQQISGTALHDTIYDFSGFQPELYEITYPAAGKPEVAKEIQDLFTQAGIPSHIDMVRGLDHGAWVVLRLLYPNADIPVVALSVNRYASNEEQYYIGKALSALREQDIMIIGSGGTVHNLRRLNWNGTNGDEWAMQFDNWLEQAIKNWDTASLFNYEQLAPYAKEAVPTPEHFIPIFQAMGAGDNNRSASLLFRDYQYGSLSLSCWKFD